MRPRLELTHRASYSQILWASRHDGVHERQGKASRDTELRLGRGTRNPPGNRDDVGPHLGPADPEPVWAVPGLGERCGPAAPPLPQGAVDSGAARPPAGPRG